MPLLPKPSSSSAPALTQLRDDGPGRPLTYAKELYPCVTSCLNKSKLVPEPKQTNANEDPYATPRKPKREDGGDEDEDEEKDAAALKAEAKREAIERERFSLHKTTRDILLWLHLLNVLPWLHLLNVLPRLHLLYILPRLHLLLLPHPVRLLYVCCTIRPRAVASHWWRGRHIVQGTKRGVNG